MACVYYYLQTVIETYIEIFLYVFFFFVFRYVRLFWLAKQLENPSPKENNIHYNTIHTARDRTHKCFLIFFFLFSCCCCGCCQKHTGTGVWCICVCMRYHRPVKRYKETRAAVISKLYFIANALRTTSERRFLRRLSISEIQLSHLCRSVVFAFGMRVCVCLVSISIVCVL